MTQQAEKMKIRKLFPKWFRDSCWVIDNEKINSKKDNNLPTIRWNVSLVKERAQARAYHWAYEHKKEGCWCGK